MGASKIDIINSALVRMGSEPILNEDDGSTRARIVKNEWPFALAMLTRSHPWRHATAYSQLAKITPKPVEIFDATYVYQIPTDCLRIFGTSLGTYDNWQEIEGLRLATDNSGPLAIKFVRLVTDSDKFGANFIEALIWLLAKNCCFAISNSVERAADCAKNFEFELSQARSFDAQIGSLPRVQSSDYIDSRRY